MVDFQTLAKQVITGTAIQKDDCLAILHTTDEHFLEILTAAYRIRRHFFGKTVRLQMLLNAKSGACQEDCHYCSQSSKSSSPIDRYGLVSVDQMVDGARRAAAAKAQRYCVVISGRNPLDREIAEIAQAVQKIKEDVPIQVCCSLGLLSEGQARELKASGVDRINHNLNTSETYHSSICTTHTFHDRLMTLQHARAAGLELCSGGIIGMGESDEDLVDLAFSLREVDPDSIPLNMLHPMAGTPLENSHFLTPHRCLMILSMFRFVHPQREIRVAGGREFNLRSLQPLALYVADSLFVGGYLTTPGQTAPEVWNMIEDLGFEVAVDYQPVNPQPSPTF